MAGVAESRGRGGGQSLQVNQRPRNWDDAFEVVLGYAFGTTDLRWQPERSFVGPAPDVDDPVRRWAYRAYDCVSASAGPELTDLDILVANGINARMGGAVIERLHAVSGELSKQIAVLDEHEVVFWELDERDVAETPADDHQPAWALWRAWSIVKGLSGAGIAVTHKVLHHKRPQMFPLLDNKTYEALLSPPDPWRQIHRDLTATAEAWEGLETAFAQAAASEGGVGITQLRLHDILLWTDAVGQWDACRAAGADFLQR